ncbi:MAG: tRNA-dihydrouridine synthase [Dysosmobacter sp.]
MTKGLLPADQQFPGEHPAAVRDLRQRPRLHERRPPRSPWSTPGADIVDLNMGCPMGKDRQQRGRRGTDERTQAKAGRIAEAVVQALPGVPGHGQVPPGLGSGTLQLCGICFRLLEQAGSQRCVAVHGPPAQRPPWGYAGHGTASGRASEMIHI